jgi:aspartate/methionine/tyrosine aminotransferase
VVSIFSLSKSYSMTGWRAGYVVASSDVVRSLVKFLENTLTCLPPFIQDASAYALTFGDKFVKQFRQEYEAKKEILEENLKGISALEPNQVDGSFYSFPRLVGREQNSSNFSRKLLKSKNVAVLPGVAFGQSGEARIRISFSGNIDELETGLSLIADFLRENG